MKVCIVGSGSQGTGLAGLLAMEEDMSELVVADYSEENLIIARDLISGLSGRRRAKDIRYALVNAADEDDVAGVIRGCDVVFHAIIPKFNLPVMRACVRERAHYLDLFASPYEGGGVSREETIDAQFALDAEFRRAGRIALPSVGMSPGWTSLAAQRSIDALDEVEDVVIRWADYLDTDEFIAPISPIVVFHEWFGAPYPIATIEGRQTKVDLLESEEAFAFPEPIGTRNVYTVTAHPDIVLIPRFAGKPVRRCEEKGGIFLGNKDIKDIWIHAIRSATSAQGDSMSQVNMMEEFSKAFISPLSYGKLLAEGKIRDHAVCFSCEVTGRKGGASVRHTSYYTSTLAESVKHLPWASPAVYGTVGGMPVELVLSLGRGEIDKSGVWSVGNLGISDALNRAMAARGQILTETIEKTIMY